MTEISKRWRIVLIITIVASLAFSIPYVFLIGTWAPIIGYEYTTPWYAQVFGVLLFMIAVWLLRAMLQKKSLEEISYFMEFLFAVMFGMIIFFVLELLFVGLTGLALIYSIISLTVTATMFVSNMIFYFMETAKRQ